MGKVVDKAMDENDAAQGYPMDALQLAVSTQKLNYKEKITSSALFRP